MIDAFRFKQLEVLSHVLGKTRRVDSMENDLNPFGGDVSSVASFASFAAASMIRIQRVEFDNHSSCRMSGPKPPT